MITFDLECRAGGHRFEGWFGSAEDMASQQARGLLSCPVCGSSSIEKRLSAPRLNLLPASGAKAQTAPADSQQSHAMMTPDHAQLRELIRHVVENTENVGQRFPEEARRIHYGEADARGIRGSSSPDETLELLEELLQKLG